MALVLTTLSETQRLAEILCTHCGARVLVSSTLARSLVEETEPLHPCGSW